MNTTHDLRDALRDQERHAPAEADVLTELNCRRRPHRISRWGVGLLAAAAVAMIVIGVSALARPHTTIPATPGTLTAPATTSSPTTAMTSTQESIDLQNAQEQRTRNLQSLQLQAQQAARSAENAAGTARAEGAAAARTCTQATSSTNLTVKGRLDATRIASTIASCARAYGARAGYTAQWVQTTVGALSTLTTGHPQRDTTMIVAVQINGTFTAGGQAGQTETMSLVLSPDGTLPPGTMTNGNAVDLAVLGTVHRI